MTTTDCQTGLFSTLYSDLRRIARREVRRNGAQHMLSTITIVHEAWLDISQRPRLEFLEPGRFLAYAARAIRGLVVDRVRANYAQKRGGSLVITSLDTAFEEDWDHSADSMEHDAITEALEELAVLDPGLAEIVNLKFFCGFTLAEVASMQGVSERTVQRKWEKARLLLFTAIRS
jgi:RNA polymerase sigma factor (TIGR02999 family)